MQNLFYRWLMDAKSGYIDRELLDIIETVEEYNRLNDINSIQESVRAETNNSGNLILRDTSPYFFKKVSDNKTVYNLFAENMQIHILNSGNEKIYSIRIKKNDDAWEFKKNDEGDWDLSHPVTEALEVYVWYDVPVLNISRSIGYSYKHGSWDKYIFKSLKVLNNLTYDMSVERKFEMSYRKNKTKPNNSIYLKK